jgi:C4-dicarboxylate-specific signal transduction histidine kinase
MSEDAKKWILNPFFTTEPIGKSIALGLAIT